MSYPELTDDKQDILNLISDEFIRLERFSLPESMLVRLQKLNTNQLLELLTDIASYDPEMPESDGVNETIEKYLGRMKL